MLLLAAAFTSKAGIQAGPDTYVYSVNLASLQNDLLSVELLVPKLTEQTATFYMPRMVPGTYHVYDFGRWIKEFKAFDAAGKEMPVNHPDADTWTIADAPKLKRITYRVEDTFDSDSVNTVFEPAGSNFETDSNFALNTHCLFGYFAGHKAQPFEINIKHPDIFYGATPLEDANPSAQADQFNTESYMELTDSPIMYSRPDTTTLKVGSAKILVSVFSHGSGKYSAGIAGKVSDVLNAAKTYLGGDLPIKKYAFIIYLFDHQPKSNSSGALEHSYSSFYYLPQSGGDGLGQMVRDVAAHEFYHIITPLTIHAEEIGDFDYQKPTMSEHLWLYEGVTEYTAHYVQMREGVTNMEVFLKEMAQKAQVSRQYFNDTLPFTKMSKLVLTPKYEAQYTNVYQKGALIGLCLDVKLRALSGGKTGLQTLIDELSKKYGKKRSFKDADLFNEIERLTYPEIGAFLRTYVGGTSPLPLEEIFSLAGYKFYTGKKVRDFTLGGINLNVSGGRFVIAGLADENALGKQLGYKLGDRIISINGNDLMAQNYEQVVGGWKKTAKEGDRLKVVVERTKKNGKVKTKKLRGRCIMIDKTLPYIIEPESTPSPAQAAVRKAWTGR